MFAKRKGLKRNEYIFYSRETDRTKPVTRQQCHRVFKTIGGRLDIDSLGTHSMRKTYALNDFRRCRDILDLQKRLGHKYLSSTLAYILDVDAFNKLDI